MSSILDSSMSNKSLARSIVGTDPKVLKDIYIEDINIVTWQRKLSHLIVDASESVMNSNPALQISQIVTPEDAYSTVNELLGASKMSELLSKDISELVDMFCYLFGLNRTGLRLSVLNSAMCPKFHVDRVPCLSLIHI